ncbi:hypothetical protein [uncultured Planococcus sp.]|nr:hypothetical protein [uncultured Planococcus sp.]
MYHQLVAFATKDIDRANEKLFAVLKEISGSFSSFLSDAAITPG